MTRSILVLRPEPGNRRTVEAIKARRGRAVACPLFEVVALNWSPPNPSDFDALLITSANAPRFGGQGLKRYLALPVHAVGASSADAARAACFNVASIGSADAASSVAGLDGLQLLHLCGADVSDLGPLADNVTRVAVYESGIVPDPAGFQEAIASSPVVLVHSTRAAARFAKLVDASEYPRSDFALAAISAKAAIAAGLGWQRLAIAAEPRDDALLDAAEALLRDLRGS